METTTVIETQRLQLREMTPADRPALCRILQDSEVMYAYNGPFSDEEVDEWLERQLARYRQYGYGLWAVVLKATGEMIGQCGLTLQQWNGREMLEAGYLFQRSHWHQGYATEAARACTDYAFGTLNSPLVCSIIRDNNLPSQQVALRNGMTRQAGVMVKHYRGAGMPHWLFVRPRTIRTLRYHSPCGEMLLGAAGDRLCLCNWAQELHPGRVEQRLRIILKAQFEECGQITGGSGPSSRHNSRSAGKFFPGSCSGPSGNWTNTSAESAGTSTSPSCWPAPTSRSASGSSSPASPTGRPHHTESWPPPSDPPGPSGQ